MGKSLRGIVNDHINILNEPDRISPPKNISSSEKPKRRFQESRRHDSSDQSISPQRRRVSSSSSPSPARDRNQGKSNTGEHTSRDDQLKRDRSGRDEEDKGRYKSRPGPMATMRLYSQSPSPPPELNQWKKRDKKIEE